MSCRLKRRGVKYAMITGYLITVFGNVRVHNVTNPLSFVDMTSLQAEPNWGVKEADAKR